MRNTKINIDRLNLRLKGIPAREAQGLLRDLGSGLLQQLAQRQEFQGNGAVKIGTADAGVLRTGGKAGGPDLQRNIAARVGDTIAAHLNNSKNNIK